MNVFRKIQLIAVAVIANGLVALCLGTPSVALASSCSPVFLCYPKQVCGQAMTVFCNAAAPAGCTLSQVICPYAFCEDGQGFEYECVYQ